MSYDGLQPVKVKGIARVCLRPDALLAAYTKVKREPIEVAFNKNWNPTRPGCSFKLGADERGRNRNQVAKIVYEEAARELQTESGYQLAEAADPDVLRVKVNIVNLPVTAPDVVTAGCTRSYVVSAGEMTISAEFLDLESGELLARALDRCEVRGTGSLMLSSGMANAGEGRRITSVWTRILRDHLDRAHCLGKK